MISKTPYVDRERLAFLVKDAQARGRASDELGTVFLTMARGLYKKYRFIRDRDEFISGAALHLLGRPLDKCDPQHNPFSWFTTCAIRYGNKLRFKETKAAANEGRYRDI